jgi:hypothetical protein
MTRDPRDETERFSLGTILTKLKVVSREDVADALAAQAEMTDDERLGELLVARGRLSREQLEIALAAQRDLRSEDKGTRALAAARLAEISSGRVVSLAKAVRQDADAVRRRSNQVGYPAVVMPAKESG